MTGKTHRVGGMFCALAGYYLLADKGLLMENVEPLTQLLVIYPFAIYGSTVSDLDHNWNSAPSKDVVSYTINKGLHLTSKLHEKEKFPLWAIFDASHRSWQTHSDLFLAIVIIAMYELLSATTQTIDYAILRLVFTGLILGIISHLVLDMLTPEGIWSVVLVSIGKLTGMNLPKKISLVPDIKFFRTGGSWETKVRIFLEVLCMMYLFLLIYQMLPYQIDFSI